MPLRIRGERGIYEKIINTKGRSRKEMGKGEELIRGEYKDEVTFHG